MTRHSEFPQIFLLMNLKEKPLKGERSFWFLLSKSLSKSATVFFRITRSVSENENEFKSQRKNYLLVSQAYLNEEMDGIFLVGPFQTSQSFFVRAFTDVESLLVKGFANEILPEKFFLQMCSSL